MRLSSAESYRVVFDDSNRNRTRETTNSSAFVPTTIRLAFVSLLSPLVEDARARGGRRETSWDRAPVETRRRSSSSFRLAPPCREVRRKPKSALQKNSSAHHIIDGPSPPRVPDHPRSTSQARQTSGVSLVPTSIGPIGTLEQNVFSAAPIDQIEPVTPIFAIFLTPISANCASKSDYSSWGDASHIGMGVSVA